MSKISNYKTLVLNRKNCLKCDKLINPAKLSNCRFDSDQIGPWSLWQGNLNTDLVIVGQDWGDENYFNKWKGIDQAKGNPTNENLQKLLAHIGIKIEKPQEIQNQIVFFTNLILCLKQGGLQGAVFDQWFNNCSQEFFKPLIDIILPKAIIALGKKTSESILRTYGIPYPKSANYSRLVKNSPYNLTDSIVLFPVYHCGAGSINRNRSFLEQSEDWLKIGSWFKDH